MSFSLRSRRTRLWSDPCLLPRVGLAVLLLAGGMAARSDQTVTVRSGLANSEGRDTGSRCLPGPAAGAFDHGFTNSDFQNALYGARPFVVAPQTYWVQSLPSDAAAKWIAPTANIGIDGKTALYAIPFMLSHTEAVTHAELTLHWAVDDYLGGGPNGGVYLNGHALDSTSGGSLDGEYSLRRSNIAPLLVHGQNCLYINVTNASGVAGLIFSATIQTYDSAIVVDTDTGTITGDGDRDDNAFKGMTFRTILADGVQTFYIPGDVSIGATARVFVTGSHAGSLVAGNDLTIAHGAVVDASAVEVTPGPGGGTAGKPGIGGAREGGGAGGNAANGGRGGDGGRTGDGDVGKDGLVGNSGYGNPGKSGGSASAAHATDGGDGVNGAGGGKAGGGRTGTNSPNGARAGDSSSGGNGGAGDYFDGDNGGNGYGGDSGEDGDPGAAGAAGLKGKPGANTGTGAALSGGGGGGGGNGGSSGQGGGGGASGVSGAGGGGGGGNFTNSGTAGGDGGASGKGGQGGDGGPGGIGAPGGAGGGALSLAAYGTLTLDGTVRARGGAGSDARAKGLSGSQGSAGMDGAPGLSGGKAGGLAGDGGSGGSGGDGGHGGTGGHGADGAPGGAGAGGTVAIIASALSGDNGFVDALGGDSGSNRGGAGRIVVGISAVITSGFSFTGAHEAELVAGPQEQNPFVLTAPETPTIPNISGGADIYGMTGLSPDAVIINKPAGAGAALKRVHVGPGGYDNAYPGFDLLLFCNLDSAPLDDPALGVGSRPVPLMVGGWKNDAKFGIGSGPMPLPTLSVGGVYATLIPSDATAVSASFSLGGATASITDTMENDDTLYIMLPHTIADATRALQIAAGLVNLSTDEFSRLNVNKDGGSANRIDMADAATLARAITGTNP